MVFILRQYSPTLRSPWTKVRKAASRRRARASALPRNWLSMASQNSPSVRKVPEEAVEVDEDRPHDPGEHDAVEADPRGSRRHADGVAEDVVIQGVAAKGKEE
jgi:hypothetical protein